MNKRRLLLPAALLLLPALAAATACGDDDDAAPAASPTSEVGQVGQLTPTPSSQAPQPLPSVKPVGDDDPSIVITSRGGKTLNPTAKEYRAFTTATVDGKTGPSVGTLAQLAGARAEAVVTILGRSGDGKSVASWRGKLPDYASNTILVMDDKGIVSMVSSTIPREQLLAAVEGISFE